MNEILSAIGTLCGNIVFLGLLPLLWWLVRWRKEISFFQWIGLYKPERKSSWRILLIVAVLYAINYFFDFSWILPSSDLSVIEAKKAEDTVMGFSSITAAFIVNFFANGFCEEVFFRGFLTKRFIAKMGFYPGLILQGVLFSGIHNLLWIAAGLDISLTAHIVMFSFTFGGAILLGYLNERVYNGSIIPSFLLHGLGNFLSMF